jgi:putative endonuclease
MPVQFYYVYILLSIRDKKFYIGLTNDLKRRLSEHKQGKNVSTAKRLPVKLIFYESFISEKDARRREKYFKTTKGKKTIRLMLRETLI